MQANETTLRDLLEGQKQLQIPLYQRRYAWETRQLTQLWTDMVGVADGQVASHFLGAVVLAPSQKSTPQFGQWTVVDGQQRLTTLVIALCALRDHLAPERPEVKEQLDFLFLTNKFKQGDLFFKLLPTQSDRQAFKACVEGGHAEALSGHVGTAYQFFRNRFQQADDPAIPDSVSRFEEVVLDRLSLVNIGVDKDDNAFRIFESINNTGMRLNQVDLIRNYVFMCLPNRGEHVYAKYWRPMQELLADPKALDQLMFLVLVLRQGDKAKHTDVYRGHQEILEQISDDEEKVEAYAADLYTRAKHLKTILDPSREGEAVRDHLRFLKEWEAQTTYPVIMRVLELRESGEATDGDLAQALSYLESFLVRRMIASMPTNNLNRIFMRLTPLLDGEDRVQDIIRQELSAQQRWVTDTELREAVRTKPFYIAGRGHQKKLVLRRLEQALGGKEKVDLDGTTIEHVLPQHLTDSWKRQLSEDGEDARDLHAALVHTLGNLTLTGYNSELGDAPYEDKREQLLQTSIELTKSVTMHEVWGRRQILQRADLIADLAIGLWPGPLEAEQDKAPSKDWTLLGDAVAILEPGSWTSYNDLAQLVGTAPQPLAGFIANAVLPGAHRVLTASGQISAGFRWADRSDRRDVREVLLAEGLTFDEKGQADPARRLSAAELAQRLDLPGAEDFAEPDPVHVDPSQMEKWELRYHRQLAARSGPAVAGTVSALLDHCRDHGYKLTFGTAPTLGRCTPVIKHKGVDYWLLNLYPETADVAFNALAKRPLFDDLEIREEIRQYLNTAPGIDLPASKVSLFPSFPCSVLADPGAWDTVVAVLDWFAHRVSLIE
ncbi:uncharacterized protein with ParB-like and HNH nuclease domain [Actinocorallia herbida]|uniref:Uncharacterized protein with ParB-like and HNH nuclease domain n=1 Tax=Actinocorallia herbida TaxID=58109 RepID=A0A3N1D3V2_9ACTN|nr:DUF262 domain-containing protein [Actinocorallia herbida]ROO88214.1 uncharacterized protein with ParB-like and HNH nuclease domain [Actinocorallia herbida]